MSIFKESREFIIEERDVTTVLTVINQHTKFQHVLVGNCGWADGEESKWYVVFDETNKQYGNIVADLSELGEFKLNVRPSKKQTDVCFERVESH